MIPKFIITHKKSFKEKYYPKLPKKFKIWWAKQLMDMMGGLDNNIHEDFRLYLKLKKWCEKNENQNKKIKPKKPEQYWNC